MSLVIFRLLFSFVDYVPVKGEIIWYLFHKAKIKGEGRGGGGRWDWLGWGGGIGRKYRQL